MPETVVRGQGPVLHESGERWKGHFVAWMTALEEMTMRIVIETERFLNESNK